MAAASLGRAAFGAAFLVAPEQAGTRWLGPVAEDERVGILLRAVGGRDVAIGMGAARAVAKGSDARAWLAASAACDAIDAAATLAARGDLPERSVWITVVLATGSAVLFGAAAAAAY
jgi:hypothetical protein